MSGDNVSEEEHDEDGGAAIPPPAKRKVRGKETHSLSVVIASTYVLVLLCYPL